MSERYTIKDVRVQAEAVTDLARKVGIISADASVELQKGSPTYGRGWRLFCNGHAFPGTSDRGYIGHSAREAYESLATIRRVLWAVMDRPAS